MLVSVLRSYSVRAALDPIPDGQYFHCKSSLDFESSAPSLLYSLGLYFHPHNTTFSPEVVVLTVVPKDFHSHIAPTSLNLQNSFVNMFPPFHFLPHVVLADFVVSCSHLLPSLLPAEFQKMLQCLGAHTGAIVPRALEGTLFSERGIVFGCLVCAQGLPFPRIHNQTLDRSMYKLLMIC